jgi:hypothetical protein
VVYPLAPPVSPANSDLVNYWTQGPEGGVLLHGWTRGFVGAKDALLVETWISQGVGIVEETIDQVYRLETYTGHPVPATAATWGAVKALFRE